MATGSLLGAGLALAADSGKAFLSKGTLRTRSDMAFPLKFSGITAPGPIYDIFLVANLDNIFSQNSQWENLVPGRRRSELGSRPIAELRSSKPSQPKEFSAGNNTEARTGVERRHGTGGWPT